MSSFGQLLPQLNQISQEELREVLDIMDQLDELRSRKKAREDYLNFVRLVWPAFIQGSHHKIMAEAFE